MNPPRPPPLFWEGRKQLFLRMASLWAFPYEKSEKKVNVKKVNFFLKNTSYNSAFGHLNHFFQPICDFGFFFFIYLGFSLRKVNCKKWMLMIDFFHFFPWTRSTMKHIGHNIGIYFRILCKLQVFQQKNAQFCQILAFLHLGHRKNTESSKFHAILKI